MDLRSMFESPHFDMQDMGQALDAVKELLCNCSHGQEVLLPMEFPDEILSSLKDASGAPSRHEKFLKKQRKAFKLARKNRKRFICDLCAKSFKKKEKIVSHMLQYHIQQQKPLAKAGSWYRGMPTQDSYTTRSNLMWQMRMQQDAEMSD